MTPPTPPPTSDTELEVLKALWDAEAATVRELLAVLADHGRTWAYTTLQTLLTRLEQKGYVTRWRTAKVLSAEDEKMLAELWELAPKMDSRINTLERILDAEAPDWRKQV